MPIIPFAFPSAPSFPKRPICADGSRDGSGRGRFPVWNLQPAWNERLSFAHDVANGSRPAVLFKQMPAFRFMEAAFRSRIATFCMRKMGILLAENGLLLTEKDRVLAENAGLLAGEATFRLRKAISRLRKAIFCLQSAALRRLLPTFQLERAAQIHRREAIGIGQNQIRTKETTL